MEKVEYFMTGEKIQCTKNSGMMGKKTEGSNIRHNEEAEEEDKKQLPVTRGVEQFQL